MAENVLSLVAFVAGRTSISFTSVTTSEQWALRAVDRLLRYSTISRNETDLDLSLKYAKKNFQLSSQSIRIKV